MRSIIEYKGYKDGILCEWDDNEGVVLKVLLNNPTEKEKASLEHGSQLSIAFSPMIDLSMFAIKFGDMPWADTSFAPGIHAGGYSFSLLFGDVKAVPLQIYGIDPTGGEVFLHRTEYVGGEFFNKLRFWIRTNGKAKMSADEYKRRLDAVYKEFASPESIVGRSSVKWSSNGHPDDRAPGARERSETHNKLPGDFKHKDYVQE